MDSDTAGNRERGHEKKEKKPNVSSIWSQNYGKTMEEEKQKEGEHLGAT